METFALGRCEGVARRPRWNIRFSVVRWHCWLCGNLGLRSVRGLWQEWTLACNVSRQFGDSGMRLDELEEGKRDHSKSMED